MTLSHGSDGHFVYSKEVTSKTRTAPTRALPFRQESLQDNGTKPMHHQGIIKGRRASYGSNRSKADIGGQVAFDLVAESIGGILEALMGTVNTTGAGPYVHTFTRGVVPTLSVQVGWQDDAATDFRKDYIGVITEGASLSIVGGQDPDFQVDYRAISEEKDTYAAVVPSYPTYTYFEFSDATLNFDAGGTECFDSVAINFANNLYQSPGICPTYPRSTEYKDVNRWAVTGTFAGDFDGTWTKYDKWQAGTEGTLQVILNAGASAQLQVDLAVVLTGESPMIAGHEVIKQAIGFEMQSATDDATACTIVLTNTDSTA